METIILTEKAKNKLISACEEQKIEPIIRFSVQGGRM